MQETVNHILNNFRNEIAVLEEGELNDFKEVEKGIQISRKTLRKLRLLVRENEFINKENEILFFKKQKPFVYGNLQFYVRLYKHLLQSPKGSDESKRIFIDEDINTLQTYYNQNLDFIRYYRQNSTNLDEFYFLRGNDNMGLFSDTCHFYTDSEFSTSHDNAVARIVAYDLLLAHYLKKLNSLKHSKECKIDPLKNHFIGMDLGWTANKIDLIELIYALQASGSIRGGKAGIKEMAMACEQIFTLDLGNYYRKFLEIRGRKIEPTKFLDHLKSSLEKRMEDADG